MKTLKNLLSRYSHIQAPNATIKKAFIKVVEEVIGIPIALTQVEIHKKTARLSAPSVVKNEIRLHQKEILEKVSVEVGDKYALTAIF